MRDATELERSYARVPVRLKDDLNQGHGVLALAGKDTALTITASEHFQERDPDTGWFDVILEENNGSSILLLNSLIMRSSMPHEDRQEWEFDIFPNIIAFDAKPILPDGNIREITFTLDRLNDVFYYEIAEWQSLYQASTDTERSLKALRTRKRPYPRGYAFFKPREVYIIHSLPRVLRERVGNRVYEIFVGHSHHRGRARLKIEAVVIATIKFDAPVGLGEAIDEVWNWRRFFQQLAMGPMRLTSMSCRRRRDRRIRSSDIYLPNLDRTPSADDSFSPFHFGPRDIPYGDWKDRRRFGSAMRRWLELDAQRRMFRVRLDRVLEQTGETSTALIADLCAAIETLDELRNPSTLKANELQLIVEAAARAGAQASPPVPQERIEGLLGMLQFQSLPQRLKKLAKQLREHIPKPIANEVIGHALRFRKFQAHGGSWDEMRIPLISPTLQVLAGMCVMWDLTTSGFPVRHGDRSLNAAGRIRLGSAQMAGAE
jgi:hypothetical protein